MLVKTTVFLLEFITLASMVQGDVRYISIYGHDQVNTCKNITQPCKSFSHAISESKENDTIEIRTNKNYTCAEPNALSWITLGEKLPLIIAKSLHFICLCKKCRLQIPRNKFAFIAGHTSKPINVSFINFEITQKTAHEGVTDYCKPLSHGFIVLRGCTLKLENCVLTRICTGIYIFSLKNDDLCEVDIKGTHIEEVHYTVYSNNASRVKLDMGHTVVIGKHDATVPYHAISLNIRGNAFVRIVGCSFHRVNEGVAISMRQNQLLLQVKQCDFVENKGQSILLSFSSKFKHYDSKINLESLIFSNNDAGFASSLHLIRTFGKKSDGDKPAPYINLSDSIFENNYAEAFFGAIYAEGLELDIKNTTFYNNSAGNEESSIQAFGGAIFVESRTNVRAFNCSFVGNTCSGFGGAVFSRGKFSAINTLFRGVFEDVTRPLLGDIIYVTAGLYLENTTWYPDKSFRSHSAIWHPGSPKLEGWSIFIHGYFHVFCPVGHNVTGHGLLRETGESTDRISMGCRSCPREEYSLQSGHLNVVLKGNNIISKYERKVSCMRCRYGGVCEKGSIKARSNYYGYLTENSEEVRFISCPYGYCCQGHDCRSYNSCSPLRQGTLCGSCIKGTTENLLNAKCVKYHSCEDKWFWYVYFTVGIIYILFFMYIDKISGFLKGQLFFREKIENKPDKDIYDEDDNNTSAHGESSKPHKSECSKPHKGEKSSKDEDIEDNENDSRTESSEEAEEAANQNNDKINPDQSRHSAISPTHEGKGKSIPKRCVHIKNRTTSTSYQNSNIEYSGSTSDVFSDITSIAFYFYQIIFIIRDHDNTILTEAFGLIKEISNSFFTFSIGSTSMLSLCPLEGLTPVSKSMIIRSMAVYVILIIFLLNIFDFIYTAIESKCLTINGIDVIRRNPSFSVRLRVTTIQITLLAYSTITNMVINFVNCVPVDGRYVLYMDGTIECFNWLQLLALLFIILWILPFPFALVLGIYRMHCLTLSYYGFILGLVFPLCFVFWEISRKCSRHSVSYRTDYENKKGIRAFQIENIKSETIYANINTISIKEILRRFEAPFKDLEEQNSMTSQPGIWQGVMIMRRLIIILLFTFVNSPVTRLYFIFVACLLFLIHHLVYLPYKNNMVNLVETFSSTILVVFCSINLFFAYSYVSNVLPEHVDSRISVIFNWLEVLILVFFPVVFFIVLIIFMIANCFRVICRKVDKE